MSDKVISVVLLCPSTNFIFINILDYSHVSVTVELFLYTFFKGTHKPTMYAEWWSDQENIVCELRVDLDCQLEVYCALGLHRFFFLTASTSNDTVLWLKHSPISSAILCSTILFPYKMNVVWFLSESLAFFTTTPVCKSAIEREAATSGQFIKKNYKSH